MKTNKSWELLHLFGAELEGETEQTSVSTPQTNQSSGDAQAVSAPVAGESTDAETRKEGFKAMMEGEYKDLFTAYFQETFNRRFKEQKEMKAELERANVLLDAAADYFGVERSALLETIRAENEKKMAPTDETSNDSTASTETKEAQEAMIQKAVEAAVIAARAETERSLLAGIRARGLRPHESALSDGSGDALRGQAGRLSKAQRADVARRAAKGERIKF